MLLLVYPYYWRELTNVQAVNQYIQTIKYTSLRFYTHNPRESYKTIYLQNAQNSHTRMPLKNTKHTNKRQTSGHNISTLTGPYKSALSSSKT